MYFFILDAFTKEPRYRKVINQISLRLSDLGIFREKERVTPIRRIDDLVRIALTSEAQNIIGIGNDATLHKIANLVALLDPSISVGLIPIVPSRLGQALGMPIGAAACEYISRRRRATIDLGKADHDFFLTSLEISLTEQGRGFTRSFLPRRKGSELACSFRCDKQFSFSVRAGHIAIMNIADPVAIAAFPHHDHINFSAVSPADGLFHIVAWSSTASSPRKDTRGNMPRSLTFLPAHSIDLEQNTGWKVTTDGIVLDRVPRHITVAPGALRVIVGPKRTFGH